MGKSLKKTPISKDNGDSHKENKKIANRRVRSKLRNLEYEIKNGKSYRKEYPSYDIADHIFYWSKEEAIKEYRNPDHSWIYWDKEFPTLEDWLNYWEKSTIRK
jgi:hypothetical protein